MREQHTPPRSATQVLRERMTLAGRGMIVAFLAGWIVWFIPFDDLLDRRGTPLGADYAMFYGAGRAVLAGEAGQLYDEARNQQRLLTLFPGLRDDFCLPYRYPPAVALLMAPLAALPYATSYAAFAILSCAALALTLAVWGPELRLLQGAWRKPVLWLLVGWPIVWETLLGGQAALFGLLLLSIGVVLLRREHYFLAGLVLALTACKPNLLAFVVLGCLLRYPRLLRGLLPGWGLLAVLSLLPGGWPLVRDYLTLGSRLAVQAWDVETPAWKVHSLASWFALLPGVSARAWSLGLGGLACLAIALAWRRARGDRTAAFYLAIGLLVSANALCNPYTPTYDLALLAVAGLLTAEGLSRWARRDARAGAIAPAGQTPGKWTQLQLAAVFFGPHASQLVAQATGLQPFTLILGALAVWQAVLFARVVAGGGEQAVAAQPALCARP